MCGILGIYGEHDVYEELLYGLNTLQHRGQDNAGMLIFGEQIHLKKGRGLANSVFKDEESCEGKMGLGHIRYATQGDSSLLNAQPFEIHEPLKLAMVHNGNVTNFDSLRQLLLEEYHRPMRSNNDIELILNIFALALEEQNLESLTPSKLFTAVRKTQSQVDGAYATIALIADYGMLAFNDPNGIRPLILGRKYLAEGGVQYIIASETTCLDYLGYEKIQALQSGQAVFIDKMKKVHFFNGIQKARAFCVFEYIYFAREDSIFYGRLVSTEREALGRMLARHFREADLRPDMVIDVPSSAYFCAQGIASELGVPYQRALIKNHYIGRSFISPNQKTRENLVKQKLNAIRKIVEGKKIAVVDDSIVRGTTSKYIVKLLKERGAQEVYFVSASPPLKYPCIYGIDISKKDEIIASSHSVEDIRKFIGAEALIFPNLSDLHSLFSPSLHCDACFSGKYPTKVNPELFESFQKEKELAKR